MKRVLVAAAALVVLAGVALVIAVYTLNPRTVAATLAARIKADTGRELTFGEVEIKLRPLPALIVSDLRFANADWGSQPVMASIASLRADISLAGLLAGQVQVTRIAVTQASLLLETDAKGKGNWVMGAPSGAPPAWLSRLEIDSLTLKPYQFAYRNGATGETTRFTLDLATLEAPTAGAAVRFNIQGQYASAPVALKGSIGGIAALLANGPAYPVEAEVTLAGAALTLRGTVDQPLDAGALNLALNAQGPELAALAKLAGKEVRPLGPFRAAATLTGTAGAPVFSAIKVEAGAPESIGFTASGSIEDTAPGSGRFAWTTSGLVVKVQGAQLHDLGELIGRPLPALGRYKIAARVSGTAAAPGLSNIDLAIGSAERVELTAKGAVANALTAGGIDLQVTANAPNAWRLADGASGPRLPPFQLRTRLRDAPQGYAADGLELRIAGSTVNATLAVATGGVRPRVTARVSTPALDLGRLTTATTQTAGTPARPGDHWRLADVDLDLQIGRLVLADGRAVQAAAGRLSLNNGRLTARALQATFGGARWQFDGTATEPATLGGLDVNFSLQGTELADLVKFFGATIPAVGPYKGTARAQGSVQTLQLTAIDASAGRTGQRLLATGEIKDTLNWKGAALNLTANLSDTTAFGRIFGADLPRLPRVRASARMLAPEGGYVLEGLRFALPRTSVQGKLTIAPGDPRTRITANLSGPLVDLGELPVSAQSSKTLPEIGVDIVADLRFDRVVLADKRALTPVNGRVEIVAGAATLRQFTVGVDGATATVDGKVADVLRQSGIDVAVNTTVKWGSGIEAFTGLDLPDLPAFTASGRVTDLRDGYAVAGLNLGYGKSSITGDVAVSRAQKRVKVTAKLASPLLNLTAFLPEPAAPATAKPAPSAARLIPDIPLPLDLLRAIDADLDLQIQQLKFGEAQPLGPILVRAVIVDGRLRADPVQVTVLPGQVLSIAGTVDASQQKNAAWALSIDGTGIDLGEFLARVGWSGVVTGGQTNFTLNLTGRGNNLRALLGGVNGTVRASVGPAQLHQASADLGTGLFRGLFNVVNPFRATDPDTSLTCLGLRTPVRDGLITLDRNLAIETAKFNVVVSGTINLRTEAIDLGATPVVARGFRITTGSLTELARVRGTLANPQIGADISGAARGALSLGAAYATMGGSLLLESLWNRSRNDPNPCATALRE